MADQCVQLLVNAPDRETAEEFATRLKQLLPTKMVLMGSGPDIPADSPPPPRYVVSTLVGDTGGTIATREAAQDAVNEVLDDLDVTIDAGPRTRALDMTVVFLH